MNDREWYYRVFSHEDSRTEFEILKVHRRMRVEGKTVGSQTLVIDAAHWEDVEEGEQLSVFNLVTLRNEERVKNRVVNVADEMEAIRRKMNETVGEDHMEGEAERSSSSTGDDGDGSGGGGWDSDDSVGTWRWYGRGS